MKDVPPTIGMIFGDGRIFDAVTNKIEKDEISSEGTGLAKYFTNSPTLLTLVEASDDLANSPAIAFSYTKGDSNAGQTIGKLELDATGAALIDNQLLWIQPHITDQNNKSDLNDPTNSIIDSVQYRYFVDDIKITEWTQLPKTNSINSSRLLPLTKEYFTDQLVLSKPGVIHRIEIKASDTGLIDGQGNQISGPKENYNYFYFRVDTIVPDQQINVAETVNHGGLSIGNLESTFSGKTVDGAISTYTNPLDQAVLIAITPDTTSIDASVTRDYWERKNHGIWQRAKKYYQMDGNATYVSGSRYAGNYKWDTTTSIYGENGTACIESGLTTSSTLYEANSSSYYLISDSDFDKSDDHACNLSAPTSSNKYIAKTTDEDCVSTKGSNKPMLLNSTSHKRSFKINDTAYVNDGADNYQNSDSPAKANSTTKNYVTDERWAITSSAGELLSQFKAYPGDVFTKSVPYRDVDMPIIADAYSCYARGVRPGIFYRYTYKWKADAGYPKNLINSSPKVNWPVSADGFKVTNAAGTEIFPVNGYYSVPANTTIKIIKRIKFNSFVVKETGTPSYQSETQIDSAFIATVSENLKVNTVLDFGVANTGLQKAAIFENNSGATETISVSSQ